MPPFRPLPWRGQGRGGSLVTCYGPLKLMFKEYDNYDAVGLAQLVKSGQVSADELLEEAIARVERINPRVNALINKLYDQARAAIAAGLPDGPLRGVPFLL